MDAFSLGYKYNFTAIAECGFATAVDSLLAVKEFVYDKKAVSLQELGQILAAERGLKRGTLWALREDVELKAA